MSDQDLVEAVFRLNKTLKTAEKKQAQLARINKRALEAYDQYMAVLNHFCNSHHINAPPFLRYPHYCFFLFNNQLFFVANYPPIQLSSGSHFSEFLRQYYFIADNNNISPSFNCEKLYYQLKDLLKLCSYRPVPGTPPLDHFYFLRDFLAAHLPIPFGSTLYLSLYNFEYYFKVIDGTLCYKFSDSTSWIPITSTILKDLYLRSGIKKIDLKDSKLLFLNLRYALSSSCNATPLVPIKQYRSDLSQLHGLGKAFQTPIPKNLFPMEANAPVPYLFQLSNGHIDRLLQYFKLAARCSAQMAHSDTLVLLSGNLGLMEALTDMLPSLVSTIVPSPLPIESLTSTDTFHLLLDTQVNQQPTTCIFCPPQSSLSKELKNSAVELIKKLVHSVTITKTDAVMGKLHHRNTSQMIVISNDDQLNTILCNQMKVDHIVLPSVDSSSLPPLSPAEREWLSTYAITFGTWLCCGAKVHTRQASVMKIVSEQQQFSALTYFMEHCCRFSPGHSIPCQLLYEEYVALCEKMLVKPCSSREFNNTIKNDGRFRWGRPRHKADDYKTHVIDLEYLGADYVQALASKRQVSYEAFADMLLNITTEVQEKLALSNS